MSKVSKEDLRKPDEFVGFFENKINQFESKRKQIVWAVVIVLLSVGVGFFFRTKFHKDNQIAAVSFAHVMEKLPSNLSKAGGDWQTFLTDMDTFIRDYPRSSMTPSAYLYKAKAHFTLKQYDQAYNAYKVAVSDLKAPYVYLALEGEAITLMQLEKWGEALTIWMQITAKEDNPLRDFHLYNLAIVQDQLGSHTEATITREKLAKDFPDSPYAEVSKLKQPSLDIQ